MRRGESGMNVFTDSVNASRIRLLLLLILLCALPLSVAAANAEVEVPHFVVVGGGGASESDLFALVGSVGQPVVAESSGGGFTVRGGFWATDEDSSQQLDHQIYLPHLSR
jgi:hypothetical protein